MGFSRFSTCMRLTCSSVRLVGTDLKHVYYTDLPLVLESNLTDGHTAVLLQVRPWRVYDSDVVFLVA